MEGKVKNNCPTVLIVDDDNEVREMLSDYLCSEGFTVYNASNGRHALDIINKITPDIAILDIILPDIDGFDICKKLKSNDNTKQTDVFFMSGNNTFTDKLKGYLAGGKRYFCKPFIVEELLSHLNHIIDSKSQRNENIIPFS